MKKIKVNSIESGQQQVIYDEGVKNKKEAKAEHKNVTDVFKSGSIEGTSPDGNSNYSYKLNENGSYGCWSSIWFWFDILWRYCF
ncbi:hypothetical protein QWY99_07895 [Flavobacterium branchiarum]|uniref:Uncharacterized protein n=1 Tax=Flavobacterium branchiarum TaxID=1114870 RepID=A0ABV5FQJ2_9FLAO|nr:hypothetical protein [Flavobacterium branchiarum]MDN3672972.1 hypothetical protein [Flavobacterium branchiarum]